jgi:hypothetical protein
MRRYIMQVAATGLLVMMREDDPRMVSYDYEKVAILEGTTSKLVRDENGFARRDWLGANGVTYEVFSADWSARVKAGA